MRHFTGLLLAACMTVAVPMTAVCYAEEIPTEESVSAEVEDNQSEEISEEETVLNIATSLEGTSLPVGTEQVTYTYHGVAYETAAKTATGLYLLPVLQEDSTVVWYVYNEEADSAVPFVEFSSVGMTFVILSAGEDVEVPSGYESVEINVAGKTVPAWFNGLAGDSNMYLVYAMDSNGEQGLYRFDGTTGICLRYVADPDVDLMNEASSISAEAQALQESYDELQSQYNQEVSSLNNSISLQQQNYNNLYDRAREYGLIGVIALGVVAFFMLLFFILMLSKSSRLRKTKKKLVEAEEQAKAAQAKLRSVRRVPSSRRAPRDGAALGDTRLTEGREEGTSRVRRVSRNQGKDFDKSTTTSKVVKVSKEEGTETAQPVRRQPSARPAQSRGTEHAARPVARSSEEAARKAPAGRAAAQRPVKPQSSEATGETKIFEKSPAEKPVRAQVRDLDDLDDVTGKPARRAAAGRTEESPALDSVELEKITEQLNSFGINDESPVEDDFIEVQSEEPEDAYTEEDKEDEDDFSLTDFKDI